MNALVRELFRVGLEHRITLNVKWVPKEENTQAEELSKLLIPDDSMLSRAFFRKLEERFGQQNLHLFASGANNQCEKFYSLHWCRGTASVNAFAFN